ncbi:MAG: type II toxin-antitoxin system PemK/MazF family toxin [Nanoarchaeota archaeon]
MKKGEIWLIKLPEKGGKEQTGIRPGLIISNTKTGMIITIPITSNIQALKFPHTIEVKKSNENGLEKDSILLIFQMQSLDKNRFIHKIGVLDEDCMKNVNEIIKTLIEI